MSSKGVQYIWKVSGIKFQKEFSIDDKDLYFHLLLYLFYQIKKIDMQSL